MTIREQIEQACKECGIPIEKFYKQDNELSWGGFRTTQELEMIVKLFSPYLKYEEIKADEMTMEELNAFYNSLRKCKHIVGWFMCFGQLNPSLWYVADEEGQTLIDVVGGVEKLLMISKGE